jgi:histidyl-tRNA synthetase
MAEGLSVSERMPNAYLTAGGEQARRAGFRIAEELRGRLPSVRISMDCMGGSLKSQLRRADRSGARFALILGEDEMALGKISVKALREDAPQVMLTADELVSVLLSSP